MAQSHATAQLGRYLLSKARWPALDAGSLSIVIDELETLAAAAVPGAASMRLWRLRNAAVGCYLAAGGEPFDSLLDARLHRFAPLGPRARSRAAERRRPLPHAAAHDDCGHPDHACHCH
ncbi:hypothetical protein [Derxia gummosa]|uniref:Uncharacterized protein n=1 Tax=Derxia gummosa DSM 723 TaxID=1121388 RepID=A0A8B6X677_9BURK|nr:hypothetical protein [Derxia gummosa]